MSLFPGLKSIQDEFTCHPDCVLCDGDGIVCESHPSQVWDGSCCDGAGIPCRSVGRETMWHPIDIDYDLGDDDD